MMYHNSADTKHNQKFSLGLLFALLRFTTRRACPWVLGCRGSCSKSIQSTCSVEQNYRVHLLSPCINEHTVTICDSYLELLPQQKLTETDGLKETT